MPKKYSDEQGQVCLKCNEYKLYENFYNDKVKSTGKGSYCKVCKKEHLRVWVANNSEHNKKVLRKWHLLTRYDISIQDYNNILELQNGVCAICKSSDTRNPKKANTFSVDHNHTTLKIRGLLCNKCNFLVGIVENNLELLFKIINYIKNFEK